MPRWRWLLMQLTRRLWFRATLIAVLGVLAALVATLADQFHSLDFPFSIDAQAIESILNIIATSMLAVTTFSLSIMTAANNAATSNATPRATRLLIEDRITQNTLSTFVGSFLFGIVGIVALKVGAYGERGRVILFLVTIAVIILIVGSLLRWIDHLTTLGRVSETADRVENVAQKALEDRAKHPCLSCTPLLDLDAVPQNAQSVQAQVIGYVQHIDISALAACAKSLDRAIYVVALPGTFIFANTPLARVKGTDALDPEAHEVIRRAFTIGDQRSFDQDPRFGLAVLSEIACRALSPGINDYGTAIDIIGRVTRQLSQWAEGPADGEAHDPQYPDVHAPPITAEDLFEDAFMLIARDGAAMIEIQLRVRKALLSLSRIGDQAFRKAAQAQAEIALQRAHHALVAPTDVERLDAVKG